MINVSDVVTDADFAQAFTVYRQTGSWVKSRWTMGVEQAIPFYGTITACSAEDLEQLPEGDRVKGAMCFYAIPEINTTNETGTSDQIEWRGERYRVQQVMPWGDFGYNKAIGVRMVGD
ncbi:hypothetical protein LJK88_20470 [Paenibacillus sp. P26]|nr:hypothetical protein LJK88_38260 [Paenibacillus sp. P26]UUZ85663.1 hypothetical protein LJK88_20470 [Paenibacillus sp. P26]UUZ93226.1 hypothetical protein LJK87_50040 [Paenibacillus sp. P25]UUZ93245.1 hypothetical protein LJK87_00025 [Paenibacillus sp. P25]UUZ95991.1 hypothetical protein LJK87_17400 [Paenibacillus sp. P25]